jgi:pimeloyl-ACP methyl ester carboxylesterase
LFVEEETKLQMRTDGDPSRPALIYLPGIHGDWTLLTGFRELAVKKYFLVQFIYPRTLSWSLEDYARAVAKALAEAGIAGGWVLAESYSSQVAWAWLKLAEEGPLLFRFDGIILAGGFVRYPIQISLGAARAFFAIAPWRLWKFLFWVYLRYSGFRHRNAPGAACSGQEFVERRTPLDIAAIRARLRLIAESDLRPIAARANCPVYLLAGTIDPIVLVRPVLRWLRQNCANFKGHRIIWPADHNVLGTEPAKALAQIDEWLGIATGAQESQDRL